MSDNELNSLGGKIGPRVAKLVSDATVATQQKLSEHKNNLAQKVLADFTNHVSDEVQGLIGGLWQKLADAEETPEELRPLFDGLANQRGQAIGWIGGSIAGTTMSAGLFDLINNWLAPVIHSFIAMNPNTFLSPESVANARIRGIDYQAGSRGIIYDALAQGINPERLDVLEQLALSRPTVNQTQDMINRGELSMLGGELNLRKQGYDADMAQRLLNARIQLLSPEVLASMFNRDIVGMNEGRERSEQSGLPADDFTKLVELYGEPLPAQALAEAFRRDFIDRARFERGIIQGPLRKEWFDVLEKLTISRMSTVDAADAVNQGHMELAEAQAIARANGLDENDFATLITLAGLPPGVDFITEALNRGFIDEETFTSAFLESRVKNKYVPLFLQMRTRLIPQETVRLLYRNGVYSREATLNTLLQHGFTQSDADALLALENTRQDGGTKELTRSQIVDMYEVRAIDLTTTITLLLSLGYSEDNAHAMVELADLKRLQKFINSAIGRVKAAFLAGRMGEADASAQLDQLGLPVEQRDDLFAVWNIDRETISKTLTPAQVRQAVKKNLISEPEAIARLIGEGYAPDDAAIFLQLTA